MGTTTFSGPVASTNGFEGALGSTTPAPVAATTITASGNATLSGSANVIIIPTSDPGVAGAIWYDVDTLKVSTGA